MIASAPGKLILTGEYAVLDGAPALVIAVDRRATARLATGLPRGSSPFLLAVARELAARFGEDHPSVRLAMEVVVDSRAFYDGTTKLGLGSSAAVTVAATALALGASRAPVGDGTRAPLDATAPLATRALRDEVLAIASAAHANAQGARGARGSGADLAAAVHGGAIVFTAGAVERRRWPAAVHLLPFFTGAAADTATLVARVAAERTARPVEVNAALTAIGEASRAACAALAAPADLAATALIGALQLAGAAFDRLALATGVDLVPRCVTAARSALADLGGTAKTTGAGGGDVAIAVIPATVDRNAAAARLIQAGCQLLQLSLDETGVDLRPAAS